MIDNLLLTETITGLIVFSIGDTDYVADMDKISAIINPSELSSENRVLHVENSCITINNLDIPLIDINRFHNYRNSLSGNIRIITFENENEVLGLIVNRIKEVLTISKEIKNRLEFIPESPDSYISGTLNYEGRKLYIIDFQYLAENYK